MAEQEKALERLNVQLDPDIHNRLKKLAAATGWSVAKIIRLCVEKSLEEVTKEALADPLVLANIERKRREAKDAVDMLRLAQSAPTPKEKK